MVASFEAEAGKMLRKPYFELGPDQQRQRLALAQRVVRAILEDPEVSFRRNATGVVSLMGGSMDNAREVMAAAANVNGYAVDVLCHARAMQLSMRQTLRLPRRCTRDELYEARRAITPYDAVAVSVRGHGGKKRAAAAVSLADLVGEQVRLAQEQGVFTPPRGTNKIPVLVCTDATPLWRAAATRCDVFALLYKCGWWFWVGFCSGESMCTQCTTIPIYVPPRCLLHRELWFTHTLNLSCTCPHKLCNWSILLVQSLKPPLFTRFRSPETVPKMTKSQLSGCAGACLSVPPPFLHTIFAVSILTGPFSGYSKWAAWDKLRLSYHAKHKHKPKENISSSSYSSGCHTSTCMTVFYTHVTPSPYNAHSPHSWV